MKIGIYGGTFNPVHYGHLRTAQEVFDTLQLDKILFIPAGKTPFNKPDLAGAHHRHEMVKRAIKGNRGFEVSDIEISRRGRSYTVDTIKKLNGLHRGCQLFFILGIDAFLDLPGWKDPDTLLDLAHVVVISRPGNTFADLSTSSYLQRVQKKTLRELDKGIIPMVSFDISGKQEGYFCNVTALDISASLIRRLLAAGGKVKYLLPDSVNSYIISNKLYK